MSATTVLARKWRPRTFTQLAGQEHVVKALCNALDQKRLHHAYLFTGTRGVGKTTIARIFAKSLNCETGITSEPCGKCDACREIDSGRFVDLFELDAASNTQVDNMRELLESALYAPTSGRFKVYIIDEVHMLSRSAFNAMLKTLEEPPGHVKFILATTDPQKIPVTVLSRCLQFNLKQLTPALITGHLEQVLTQEGVSFEPAALALIARAAQGSMRDALSLTDQAIAFSASSVEEAVVRTMLGAIDRGYVYDLLDALQDRDGGRSMVCAEQMAARSVAFDTALQEVASLLHRIALAQTVPAAIAEDDPERERILQFAQRFSPEELQLYYQIAIHGRDEIELAPDEFAGFTMTLLRMLAFAPQKNGGGAFVSREPVAVMAEPRTVEVGVSNSSVPELVPPSSAVAADERIDWSVLLGKLNVIGMAQQMARHCVLKHFSEGEITLGLAQAQKHFLTNRSATEKLQAALSEYFAKPVRLKIDLCEPDAKTPALAEQLDRDAKQLQANESIAQDDFVGQARTELGASVLAETIRSI